MNATKYSMEATYEFKEPSHRRTSSRHSHHTDDDGNGSLTYSSAASSANSATGESTDSSFADIMKVLDGQESSKDIALYLQQKEMVGRARHDEKSVADSLAYSTDADTLMGRSLAYSTDADTLLGRSLLTEGESHYLHGTDLLSTVTGYVSSLSIPQSLRSISHFTVFSFLSYVYANDLYCLGFVETNFWFMLTVNLVISMPMIMPCTGLRNQMTGI